jgi:uracil-DNA glycosylase
VNELKVVFVGCNPSLKNTSAEPFKGTASGKILARWIKALGLTQEQCAFVNLTDTATQTAAALKKKDIDIGKFQFNLFLKFAELAHGQPAATNIMLAKMQQYKRLDIAQFIPLPDEELKEYLDLSDTTPVPMIIALGSVAAWGMAKTKLPFYQLPHPSGLNRKLNDKEGLDKVLASCKEWLYSLPEQSTNDGSKDVDSENSEDNEAGPETNAAGAT